MESIGGQNSRSLLFLTLTQSNIIMITQALVYELNELIQPIHDVSEKSLIFTSQHKYLSKMA